MRAFLEIAYTGVTAILLHPLRSATTITCLIAVLLPYLVGLGLSHGIQKEAETAILSGADLYVSGNQLGRTVPVPLSVVPSIRQIQGVTDVIPRIVGDIVLGKEREHAVLVGLPAESFPSSVHCVEGDLPRTRPVNELVVGNELARRLHLEVGTTLPPFYHNDQGERLSRVVGIFDADVSLWQARLVFTTFETAAHIFAQEQRASDLLVFCRPGYQARVTAAILQSVKFTESGAIRPQVTTREELQAILPRGLLHREGLFNLHFLLAFAVAILVVLETAGLGLRERRREIGILKATGWQTDEVLLRSVVESILLSVTGAATALLSAFIWLRWGNGYWIASLFLAGVDMAPSFRVPFRLMPVPALLAFVISFTVVMSGTLYATWRAATISPREAMR